MLTKDFVPHVVECSDIRPDESAVSTRSSGRWTAAIRMSPRTLQPRPRTEGNGPRHAHAPEGILGNADGDGVLLARALKPERDGPRLGARRRRIGE